MEMSWCGLCPCWWKPLGATELLGRFSYATLLSRSVLDAPAADPQWIHSAEQEKALAVPSHLDLGATCHCSRIEHMLAHLVFHLALAECTSHQERSAFTPSLTACSTTYTSGLT